MRSIKSLLWLLAGLLFSCAVLARTAIPPGAIAFEDLPPEARQTIRRIQGGGPFPYARDGVVFGNVEGLLPKQKRGYYHEFTVGTPGARNRGARRIVTGGKLPEPREYFYTDDHYASFKRIIIKSD